MKPVKPDAVLSAVVGGAEQRSTDVSKKIWAYIKRRGLQDKKKRTMINVDSKLKSVFRGKKQISMFEMTKVISKHLK